MKMETLVSEVNGMSCEIDVEFLRSLVNAIHSQYEVRHNIVDDSQPRRHPDVITELNGAEGLASAAQAIAVHSCRGASRAGRERNPEIIK